MHNVRWVSFDFGQTLMDPTNERTKVIMGVLFIALEADQPGIIDRKVQQYKQLRDRSGGYARLKEAGRAAIYDDVLEGNPVLISRYDEVEQKLLKPAPGL